MSELSGGNRSTDGEEATASTPDGDPIRRSVEVEYWVVDEGGRLTAPGDLVDAAPGVEREFVEPLLEIKTTPCESTEQLREELFGRISRVLERAETADKGLVPLATPMQTANPIEDLPSERTRIQDRVVGEDFECVRHCAGTHIHVEQQPGREMDQLNTLIALDPALALVNSSPYYRGDGLVAGARSKLYRWMAYESLPYQGQLWRYVDDREEWGQRLDRRYAEFVTKAVIAGFDREVVESCFDPEGAVWTPVQLREEFSTVEWRSPDAALPSQVVRLADDIVGVVEHLLDSSVRIGGDTGGLTDDSVVLPEFDAVTDYVESAIREGISSDAVRAYLERFGFDPSAYDPVSHDVDCGGELTVRDARAIRLEYADRLDRDVRQPPSISAD
jgi:gamma-glutamyl:cysteine ligase YbdK (ATP-grasp superfamily)